MSPVRSSLGPQQGMSLIGMLALVLTLLFIANSVVKLGPVYLENYTLQRLLEKLELDANTDNMSRMQVLETMRRRLSINNIDSVDVRKVKISDVDGQTLYELKYEVRQPFFGNLDTVVRFGPHFVRVTQP